MLRSIQPEVTKQARIAQQHLSLAKCHEGTHSFERIKRFACSRYADVHQARLRHFLPIQMLLSDGPHWLASCGLKVADTWPLFLEQDLDLPIEQTLSRFAIQAVRFALCPWSPHETDTANRCHRWHRPRHCPAPCR
ncbi:thermostable hemolysin [Marinobacterium rhizophilum]|uniref:thermostable hemolysin n=1 Tax=Marinobacterium rhizophilum TaxID=420402 RepID=UPI0009FD9768